MKPPSVSSRAGPRRGWLFRMAWRDARRYRRRLLLFTGSIVFGITALVAIRGFGANLERTIDAEARTLLGADLEIRSRQPLSPEVERLLAGLDPAEEAREIRFGSMAVFPGVGEAGFSRLVTVRALRGGFPWYGAIETAPAGLPLPRTAEAAGTDRPEALVDAGLMAQTGLQPGDPLRLGQVTYRVSGAVEKIPGEAAVAGIFSPRVLIPMDTVEATGLVQYGSLIRYFRYYRFPGGFTAEQEQVLAEARPGLLIPQRIGYDTVDERKEEIGRVLTNLYAFLNLVGFIALLLGAVGIGGAVQIYLKDKQDSVAVLRCLGATAAEASWIFVIQIAVTGLIGVLVGAALGLAIQFIVPALLQPFLPVEVVMAVHVPSLLVSLGFGWGFTLLVTALPLLPVRRISPLRAIRSAFESTGGGSARRDPWVWLVVGALAVLILGFCLSAFDRAVYGLAFAGTLAGVLGLLALLAWLLRWVLRRLSIRRLPWVWRQGLSNLHRPQNRTLFLVVTLGMGCFLIFTLVLVEQGLLRQGALSDRGEQPNLLFFDIQPDQLDGVLGLVEAAGYPILARAPVVTMRLSSINDRSVRALREDGSLDIERWPLLREYRSTYAAELAPHEEVTAGTFTGRVDPETTVIPVSVEETIIKALNLELGDRLTWDVQGVPMETEITSIRTVDWNELRPNFFVVFPAGVLEPAPRFHLAATRVPDRTAVATLQQSIVTEHPNVSAVDLNLILDTLGRILDRVAFVLRFMASFTLLTGVIALCGTIVTSRYQRVRESVLLRTLGASGRQVRRIMSIEYALVGFLGGLTGVLLAQIAADGLARWVFEIEPAYAPGFAVLAIALTTGLTWLAGLANSRGIASHPPLAVLRNEG
ncbi:MAG: ABC transporter permease [Opitutales bacterium]